MPMTPNRKPSIVSDRRQSIMGPARVVKSTGVHVDPDVAYIDHGKRNPALPTYTQPETREDLGVCPVKNEGERYFDNRMDQQEHEAEQARRPRGRPKKASIPGRQGFQISDPEPAPAYVALPIETAPPIPPRQASGEWNRYPVADMKDGDFFFIPKGGAREMAQVRALAHRLKKVVKIRGKFTHNGTIGVGVWKV